MVRRIAPEREPSRRASTARSAARAGPARPRGGRRPSPAPPPSPPPPRLPPTRRPPRGAQVERRSTASSRWIAASSRAACRARSASGRPGPRARAGGSTAVRQGAARRPRGHRGVHRLLRSARAVVYFTLRQRQQPGQPSSLPWSTHAAARPERWPVPDAGNPAAVDEQGRPPAEGRPRGRRRPPPQEPGGRRATLRVRGAQDGRPCHGTRKRNRPPLSRPPRASLHTAAAAPGSAAWSSGAARPVDPGAGQDGVEPGAGRVHDHAGADVPARRRRGRRARHAGDRPSLALEAGGLHVVGGTAPAAAAAWQKASSSRSVLRTCASVHSAPPVRPSARARAERSGPRPRTAARPGGRARPPRLAAARPTSASGAAPRRRPPAEGPRPR